MAKTRKQMNPAEQRRDEVDEAAYINGAMDDMASDQTGMQEAVVPKRAGMGNSAERVAEQKKFKMKKAKDKLKKKAASKRMTQADVDARSSANGGSTAPIPGADSVAPLTEWEKKYGSKK